MTAERREYIVTADSEPSLVQSLFCQAIDLPAADRHAFVLRACESKPQLAREILDLLGALGRAGDYLNAPPPKVHAKPTDDVPAMPVGARLGPYRLLERIGEGGFGTVFMAEQTTPIRRRVALKVIKPGMDTRQVIARFEAERQALALMDHPNIAHVYDAGQTDDGRPYFVMELVRGESISAFCDSHRVSLMDRLELFSTVCHAVQHAHHKGVIHRDLKPNNILVALSDIGGGKPVAKIIDFGIAKAMHGPLTDRTLFTEFKQMIGTPAYMSPEQAQMTAVDIDTRSDIYSLGAVLYELLTGTTPFDPGQLSSGGLIEMQRVIREVEPARPSTRVGQMSRQASDRAEGADPSSLVALPDGDCHPRGASARRQGRLPLSANLLVRRLRGELDWIVRKCLEKDRTRRYTAAADIADDLSRYLRHEPVLAGPPGWRYRLGKAARRHRAALFTSAMVLTAMVIATAGSLLGLSQARAGRAAAEAALGRAIHAEAAATRERDAARAARDAEAGQRRQAERQETQARQITSFTTGVLALADPIFAQRPNATVSELLDVAAARVGTDLVNAPMAEASIRATIGKAYQQTGRDAAAMPHLRRALEIMDATGLATKRELCDVLQAQVVAMSNMCDSASLHRGIRLVQLLRDRLFEANPEIGQLAGAFATEFDAAILDHPRFEKVKPHLDALMRRTREIFPRGHADLGTIAVLLLMLGNSAAEYAEQPVARDILAAALQLHDEAHGEADPRSIVAFIAWSRREAWFAESPPAEAELARRHAVAVNSLGVNHIHVTQLAAQIELCAALRGDRAALTRFSDIAAELERRLGRGSAPYLAQQIWLPILFRRFGEDDAAERHRREYVMGLVGLHSNSWERIRMMAALAPRHSELAALLRAQDMIGPSAGRLPRDAANEAIRAWTTDVRNACARVLAPDDPTRVVVSSWLSLCVDLWEETWGNHETLRDISQLALELSEPFETIAPFVVSRSLTGLINHRTRPGSPVENQQVEARARRCIALRKSAAIDPWWAYSAQRELGEFLCEQGRYPEAAALLAESHEVLLMSLGAADPNTRLARAEFFRAMAGSGDFATQPFRNLRAYWTLYFTSALGKQSAERLPQWVELERLLPGMADDAAVMRAGLELRRRLTPGTYDRAAALAELTIEFTRSHLLAGGALEVCRGLLDDAVLTMDEAQRPLVAIAVLLAAANLCVSARAWTDGETYADTALRRTTNLLGENGQYAAIARNLAGACAVGQGRQAEGLRLMIDSYHSLMRANGPDSSETRGAFMRVITVHGILNDWTAAATIATDYLRQRAAGGSNEVETLNNAAWYVARVSGLPGAAYALAEQAAQLITRRYPDNASYVNTLGVALCRTGRHAEAVEVLRRSDALATAAGKPEPIDWAMLAVAHHALGDAEQCRMAIQRMRELMRAKPVAAQSEEQRFADEAEAVCATRPAAAN